MMHNSLYIPVSKSYVTFSPIFSNYDYNKNWEVLMILSISILQNNKAI